MDDLDMEEAEEESPPSRDPGERAPLRPLSALAAEASGGVGICCPRCGCGHSSVAYTYDVGGARRRKRVCRHCGREFATTER